MRRGGYSFVWLFALVCLPQLVSAEDKFFDSNGVRIRYVEQGSGEPVVLIHGFSSTVELNWGQTGILTNLAKDHHVIAFDARGHGKSGKPHDPKAYGPEMARDVGRLLDHLKIAKAHIVGYSMGGMTTAQFLTMAPNRFITATLGGYGAPPEPWTEKDERDTQASADEFLHGRPLHSVFLRTWPTDRPAPSEEDYRKWSEPRAAFNDWSALAAVIRSRTHGATIVTPAQLAKINVPTMAVIGSADGNLKNVKATKEAWPALKVFTIEGASHTGERGALTRPEFVNAIREFIAAHKQT